jgi:hypothetical protein
MQKKEEKFHLWRESLNFKNHFFNVLGFILIVFFLEFRDLRIKKKIFKIFLSFCEVSNVF